VSAVVAQIEAPASEKDFVLLGYFPKRVSKPGGWPLAPKVEQVYSVSECMSAGPEDWIGQWRHNAYFFFDSEAIARDVAGDGCEIFAYRVPPRRFGKDGVTPIELSAPDVEPLPPSFRFIGFDIVECWQKLEERMPIECSPLSCNSMSTEIPVNRYCLIETLDEAYAPARRFGAETDGVEPGPYYLFQLFRQARIL
jgi:hypothetical protein